MSKIFIIMGGVLLLSAPSFAQDGQSTINKCDNGKDPIVYTEFDCPEGYEIVTEGWLSETNMTSASAFGSNDENINQEYEYQQGNMPE